MPSLQCIGGNKAFICFGREGVSCTWALYFRVFGYGLHLSDRPRIAAYFSERYGLRKAWYALGVRVEALRPNK